MTTIPNYYQYLMKLIPDYSYVDYAEKDYWQDVKSGNKIWYYMSSISNNESTYINSYRCLLVSPVELSFTIQPDQYIFKLKDYADRKVYVFFQTDDADKQKDSYRAWYKPTNDASYEEYPYIVEVCF